MFKTDFFVAIEKKDPMNNTVVAFKKVSGWGETMCAPNGEIIEIRLDRRDKKWYITEEATGMLVGWGYNTRKDALTTLTPEILSKISNEIKRPEKLDVINRLADYIINGGGVI